MGGVYSINNKHIKNSAKEMENISSPSNPRRENINRRVEVYRAIKIEFFSLSAPSA